MADTNLIWNDKMSVGIEQFDEHHKVIISMIAKLSSMVAQGVQNDSKNRELIGGYISELRSYVKYHFNAEERIMQKNDYSEYEQHVKEHRYFAKRIIEYQSQYAEGKDEVVPKLLHYLKEWFVTHIMNIDKKYGAYLASKGIS